METKKLLQKTALENTKYNRSYTRLNLKDEMLNRLLCVFSETGAVTDSVFFSSKTHFYKLVN